jgi:hypothetical protein
MADTYTVLSQKQNVQINPASTGFEDVWEVTYKVTAGPSKGTTATLSVPEEDHNAKYIDTAIRAKIADLDAVAGM